MYIYQDFPLKGRSFFMRKNIKQYGNLILSLVLLTAVTLLSLSEGFITAGTVREECLRLHILAASDSEEDQNVKLLVRDAVLKAGADIFSGSESSEEAMKKISENKALLEETANNVLRENGFSYKAHLTMEKEYFETRQYEDVRLPAGQYNACKIILGDGDGQNWWCVMFPPLCLPAVTKNNEEEVYAVFGENGGNLVTEKNGYKIKFRIVEIINEFIEDLRAKNKD